jgi:hypothetical protein
VNLSEINEHIELYTDRMNRATNPHEKQMFANMVKVWEDMKIKTSVMVKAKQAIKDRLLAAKRPPGVWLVKILRATNADSPDVDATSHSYEIEFHSSSGASDTAIVPLHIFDKDWSNEIRMGKSPYGIRDNGTCRPISEAEYKKYLKSFKSKK